MHNYNLLNRAIGEIITLQFRNIKQIEDFLPLNKQFEFIDTDLHISPFRGTRQIVEDARSPGLFCG